MSTELPTPFGYYYSAQLVLPRHSTDTVLCAGAGHGAQAKPPAYKSRHSSGDRPRAGRMAAYDRRRGRSTDHLGDVPRWSVSDLTSRTSAPACVQDPLLASAAALRSSRNLLDSIRSQRRRGSCASDANVYVASGGGAGLPPPEGAPPVSIMAISTPGGGGTTTPPGSAGKLIHLLEAMKSARRIELLADVPGSTTAATCDDSDDEFEMNPSEAPQVPTTVVEAASSASTCKDSGVVRPDAAPMPTRPAAAPPMQRRGTANLLLRCFRA